MSTFILPSASTSRKTEVTLLYAISRKSRSFDSLKRTLDRFIVRRAVVTEFNARDYLHKEDLTFWKATKRKVLDYLADKKIPVTLIETRDDSFGEYFAEVKKAIDPKVTVVIDITTFPNNYVLKLCQELEGYDIMYQYTRGERPTATGEMFTEEEKNVGVSKIVSIAGFKGEITLNAATLLVLVLGFESNRALASLGALAPQWVLALIGSPGCGAPEKTESDSTYVDGAREANKLLLASSFVREKEVNSVVPKLFQRQLTDALQSEPATEPSANVVIVPMGTKAQTVGLYLYWKKNPKTQILYPVPNRRPRVQLSTGETYMYDRDGNLLKEYSWIDSSERSRDAEVRQN